MFWFQYELLCKKGRCCHFLGLLLLCSSAALCMVILCMHQPPAMFFMAMPVIWLK